MWGTNFHTHEKQLAELWVLCILTFTFLDNRHEGKKILTITVNDYDNDNKRTETL
jgi:hypothetical protein